MVYPKGLEWNQVQLQIAKMLQGGQGATEICQELELHLNTVKKVKAALAEGQAPPSLEEAYIAAAPKPTTFPSKGSKKVKPEVNPNGGGKTVLKAQPTVEITETAMLSLIPKVQNIPLTPDIFISYMCALAREYKGSIDQWLSLVSRDFWEGRDLNPYEIVSKVKVKKGGA